MNLTIKRIPEAVGVTLKRLAAAKGRSLNAELLEVLGQAAALEEHRQNMRASLGDLESFVARLPRSRSSVPLLRAERNRH